MKNYLIISDKPPLYDLCCEETLELALSISSIEHSLSILLLSNAVLQLLDTAKYALLGRTLLDQTINAYKFFEFKKFYIEKNIFKTLQSLGFKVSPEFDNKAVIFDMDNLTELYKQHDLLWFF